MKLIDRLLLRLKPSDYVAEVARDTGKPIIVVMGIERPSELPPNMKPGDVTLIRRGATVKE